jgi:transcriptional regulator with XRE-family HTH domain
LGHRRAIRHPSRRFRAPRTVTFVNWLTGDPAEWLTGDPAEWLTGDPAEEPPLTGRFAQPDPRRDDNSRVRGGVHHPAVPLYERPIDRGVRRGRFLVGRTATELLTARRAAGMSQRELGRQARASRSRIGRAERGEPDQLTIELAARVAAVLGLQLSVTLHPDGDPVRDAAHLALLERLHARLPSRLRWRTEVPMPIDGDQRSADAVIGGPGVQAVIEAETRLVDVQAVERRINAKLRDLGIGRVILLVADTRHNRSVVAQVPELRTRFPTSTRACLSALALGRDPGGDALVFL